MMRPTARSLSACSASGVGGPPVWSSMIHRMLNAGTVPAATSLLEVLQPQIDAELVGNAQIELREVLDEVLRYTAGTEECAWTVF